MLTGVVLTVVVACLAAPWAQYLRAEWWPRYRHRRSLDYRMMGTSEGHMAMVVEPAPWHLRRLFWRLVYPTTPIHSKTPKGATVALCAVVTYRSWRQGRPLYECGRIQRRFKR